MNVRNFVGSQPHLNIFVSAFKNIQKFVLNIYKLSSYVHNTKYIAITSSLLFHFQNVPFVFMFLAWLKFWCFRSTFLLDIFFKSILDSIFSHTVIGVDVAVLFKGGPLESDGGRGDFSLQELFYHSMLISF